ncbi:TonB-dependent receptor [Novosphingobium album (ex Hu et al. 2023)]|uniref:TonB-dependent receptor n=1 Tax=Novosphingobium album (ex Hu et al. 2023) TaxID=2930093 RepID=A0ABT0B1D5_9SPHN|nr:TonB-dependent receptor [Novosphingobium album (ex Hu et al. 2023)]MCJ2178698.1 TonB-dependent receptor [Novosphingobium album (ex Hu et al. 2023)]
MPASALADEAEAAAEASDADSSQGGLGDIVVTATRTSESVQKVPISMQALASAKLDERQVKGLSDFSTLLPSVSIAGLGPGRQTPYFRGIVPAGGSYASVGYYLDDIPIAGTGLPDIHVYDVERIEALSGPQGTLYGAGSLAGTIRFISNKPKIGEFEFGYDVEGNKYGDGAFGGQFESYVNVPVSDTVAIRAMGYYRRDGGYVDNKPNNGTFTNGSSSTLSLGDDNPATSYTLDNSDIAKDDYNPIYEYGGRVQLLWEPAPDWEIKPELTAQRQIAYGYFGYDPRVGDLEVHDYDLTRQDDKWYQAQLAIHGHIGDWDLVSATGYYQRKVHLRNDYTYYTVTYDGFGPGYENYLQFFDASGCSGTGADYHCTTLINPQQYYEGWTRDKQFTQELRLSTPKSWPFDITAGGFYQYRKQETNSDYAIHGLDTIAGYTMAGGGDTNYPDGYGVPVEYGGTMVLGSPAVKRDAFYLSERNNTWKDKAIFAEGHYNITPTLKITGGIRYFWTEFATVGFSGVMASARSTSTSLYVPTGEFGCPVPLPDKRLQCLNTNVTAADQVGRYKEDGETHKVALDWQFSPTKMVYFNYSTGFRPGGFNRPLRIRGVGIAAAPAYDSETLTNFELGVKTTWNNIFRFNAAVYYETWDNIQYSVVISGTQGAGMTGNAGKAKVKGVEYDADLKLGNVTISSSGAYNDAALSGNFCNFAVDTSTLAISQLSSCTVGETFGSPAVAQVAAVDGTRLPRQPKFKGTTSIRYETMLGDMDAYFQGAALYQTGATQNLNVYNNNLLVCPDEADTRTTACATKGFVTFDFSAGIKKDNWHLDVFIQNAFDKRGPLTMNTFCSITFCSGSSRTFPVKPQFMGIKFGQKF